MTWDLDQQLEHLEELLQPKPIQTREEIIPETHQQNVEYQLEPGTINTTQQFLTWFESVEKDMERGQEDVVRNYLEILQSYDRATMDILAKTRDCSALLDELEAKYVFVESKTKGLQHACEEVLDEQNHLISITDELSSKLAYFNDLEPITKVLSASGDVVLEPEFKSTLTRLDECLQFLIEHSSYKDTELYKMRYRQCLTRGLTLIKMAFVDAMRALSVEIKEKLESRATNEPLPSNLQVTLLYVKFRSLSAKLKPLMSEIEDRCHSHPEYFGLLRDCCNTYFSVRRTLLIPFVQQHVSEIQSQSQVSEFASAGCAYIIRLCRDELQLFRQFFIMNDEDVNRYLEGISRILYDQIRPLILKETRIDILSELCQTLLNFLASEDDHLDLEVMMEEDEESSPIKVIVHQILEDTQQRLCFRAETFIRQELQSFVPREQELLVFARGRGCISSLNLVPEPMSIQSAISVEHVLAESASRPRNSVLSEVPQSAIVENAMMISLPEEYTGKMAYGGGEWYPTLQKSLYILNRIRGCVPGPIFEDLAEDIVNSCRESLILASDILSKKQTRVDGQLFLMKNLLMLREQIAGFDGHMVVKEERFDFSQLIDALKYALQATWNFGALANLSRSILSAGRPRIVADFDDAKQSLDLELKKVCEDFILETAKSAVEPISSFMLKVSAFELRNNANPSRKVKESLSSQSFASPAQVTLVYSNFKETLENRLKFALAKMKDYLGDKRTQGILLRIIRSNILDNYASFYEKILGEYPPSIVSSIGSLQDLGNEIDALCESIILSRGPSITSIS